MNTPTPPTSVAESGMSASRRVYLCLRQRIVEMSMLPGERVVERDIAEEFGTSRTPVHEAVQRLADEGLIEVIPRSGTFVARIPLDQLEEANLVRHALETGVIEKAAERAGRVAVMQLATDAGHLKHVGPMLRRREIGCLETHHGSCR